jgi:hypothetical protein
LAMLTVSGVAASTIRNGWATATSAPAPIRRRVRRLSVSGSMRQLLRQRHNGGLFEHWITNELVQTNRKSAKGDKFMFPRNRGRERSTNGCGALLTAVAGGFAGALGVLSSLLGRGRKTQNLWSGTAFEFKSHRTGRYGSQCAAPHGTALREGCAERKMRSTPHPSRGNRSLRPPALSARVSWAR